MRYLARRPHLHALLIVEGDQAGVGLHVRLVHLRGRERVLDDHVRRREAGIDVSDAPLVAHEAVRRSVQRVRQPLVGGHAGVDQRRARPHRLQRVVDGRQLLVLNVDQRRRALGRLLVVRGNGGHRVADEAHHVVREHRRVLDPPAQEVPGDVGARQHRVDPRLCAGSRDVDANDPRMRQRRAQHLGPQPAAGRPHVGGIFRRSRDLFVAVGPRDRDPCGWRRISIGIHCVDTPPTGQQGCASGAPPQSTIRLSPLPSAWRAGRPRAGICPVDIRVLP